MELFEYIKSQLPQMPNVQIMKDMGASDELVEYVKESPENTNLNVIGSITNPGGGGDAEVWLVGDTGTEQDEMMQFVLSNVGDTDHMAELWTNAENYQVFLNGAELPYFFDMSTEYGTKTFADSNTEESISKMVQIQDNAGVYAAGAYTDASTAPTSVEVSVKAK